MKYYVVVVGVTNGIPDMFIDEADSYEEMGALLAKYHNRSIKQFAELDKDQFTSDFIEGTEVNDA